MFRVLPTGARTSSSSSSASIIWLSVSAAIWNLLVSSSTAAGLKSPNSIRVCPPSAINQNLLDFQRCSPDEFYEVTSCGHVRETLSCSKGKYIAVHSASAGKSRRGESSAVCVRTAITNETDCSVGCVLDEVVELCLGKRRCEIGANDRLFSRPCLVSSGPLPEHRFLWLLYTCVSKNVTNGLRQKTAGPPPDELRCPEDPLGTTPTTTPAELRLQGPSSTRKHHGGGTRGSQATRVNVKKETQVDHNGRGENQDGSWTTGNVRDTTSLFDAKADVESAFTGSSADQTTKQPTKNREPKNGDTFVFLESVSEMIWIVNYVSDNSEKCILYFLVCIFLGIILVLIVLILHSVHRKRKSERYQFPAVGVRLTDSSNSLKWRMADSESSVDDVDDVRRTPEGPHTSGPPGRQWGPHHHHHHGRPIRAWSPPPTTTTGTPDQTSTTVNPTQQLEAKPNGVRLYGPRLDERGPRNSSEEAEVIPLHVGRTQSLTRGPHPNEPQYSFPEPKSLTIQPTSRRNVEL